MDETFLDNNLEGDDREAMLQNLILNAAREDPSLLSSLNQQTVPTQVVVPVPGFCVKTKNEKNKEKAFINICMSDNVPAPKEMSDKELIELLESEDPSGYRIPMSIGEPHAELDKGGAGCTAYDVVVSPTFMEKMKDSELFRTFFLTVMIEGLESKYEIELSREYVILKNKRFVGKLQEQNVRTKSKPFIMEMDDSTQKSSSNTSNKLIQEVDPSKEDLKSKGQQPDFRIVQEPASGYPEFLVAEINLPQVKTSTSLSLDLGEDRIVLETRSNSYHLDIFIPFNIVSEESGAQFNRQTRILTITMPVQEQS